MNPANQPAESLTPDPGYHRKEYLHIPYPSPTGKLHSKGNSQFFIIGITPPETISGLYTGINDIVG